MSKNKSSLRKDSTRTGANSGNDEHGTPIPFIRELKQAVGGSFDLDPCSGAEPHPIAQTRFTKEDNGLAQDWFGVVYVNPPYSALKTWMKKVVGEINRSDTDAPETIICLLPAYTSAHWFQEYATQADLTSLVDGRLSFHGSENQANFHSTLVAFGNITEDIAEAFDSLGTIYTRVQVANATEQQRLDDLFQTDGGAIADPSSNVNNQYPTTTANQGIPGPTVRDLSRESHPGELLDITTLGMGDEIYIELDDSMMGFPEGVSVEMHTSVIGGACATPETTQTPDEHHTVLCIHEPTETYVCLYQDPNTLTDLRCSVAPEGYGWTDVHLNTIQRTETHYGPSAANYHGAPYCNGTEYADTTE